MSKRSAAFAWWLWLVIFTLLPSTSARAQLTAAYISGLEGIKSGTLPPPGSYARQYFFYYGSDQLNDGDGNELDVGFDYGAAGTATRLIWMTDKTFLGAQYGVDIVVPLVRIGVEIDALGLDASETAIGDILLGPLFLGWHTKRADVSLGYNLYVPTGESDLPADPGKGYYTHLISFGFTWYFDADKTWSASILPRYEIHEKKDGVDVTAGDDFHFEWGIGKAVRPTLEFGVSGYGNWQVSDDSGADVTWDPSVHDRVLGIGPEVIAYHVKSKLLFSLQHSFEFGAIDRPEGALTKLSVTRAW